MTAKSRNAGSLELEFSNIYASIATPYLSGSYCTKWGMEKILVGYTFPPTNSKTVYLNVLKTTLS